MKRTCTLITLCMLFIITLHAQTTTGNDYFMGKWNVLIKGTPQGDVKMEMDLQNTNDSINGSMLDTTGAEISKISKAEVSDSSITVYFTAQGYDLSLVMMKKDDDHISGSLINMFNAEGERKKD